MKNLSVQDWCAIVGTIIALCGVFWGIAKFFHKKMSVKAAKLRANFFKSNKSWNLRIYNASEEDIEAFNIEVIFPDNDGIITSWECDKDKYPSLKKHGHFDIKVMLCTSAPDILPIEIIWDQGKHKFTATETVQLR